MASMSTRAQVNALLALITEAAHSALDEYEKYGKETPSLNDLHTHPLDTEENRVHFQKVVSKLVGACDQLCATLAPPAQTVMLRGQEYGWACLRVAVKIRLADILSTHPDGLHIRDLSSKVGIPPFKLATIIRLLATKHCFREVAPDVFANNRLSMTLLSSAPSSSLVDLVTFEGQKSAIGLEGYLEDPEYCRSVDPALSVFMHTIKDKGYNMPFYAWLQLKDQHDRRAVFGRAMLSMNQNIGALSALHAYPWDQVHTMCDVGSGIGGFTRLLLKQNPTIHATLFDLPNTIALARKDWGDEFSSRVSFVGGDFFTGLPAKYCDVYYLRNILHNWPDDEAVKILRTIRAAMKPESRVLVHDQLLRRMDPGFSAQGLDIAPEPLLPNFGAGSIQLYNQNLIMLFMYNSKERTIDEMCELALSAGFHLANVWDLGEMCLLDFIAA